jgi:hypothetical protein
VEGRNACDLEMQASEADVASHRKSRYTRDDKKN